MICDGDEEKRRLFLYIRLVRRFFVSTSSCKAHSFSPVLSFLMTFKCLFVGTDCSADDGKHKVSHPNIPSVSIHSQDGSFYKNLYKRWRTKKEREVCLADCEPEETLLYFLLTACQRCFSDQQDFHQMVIKIFFFLRERLSCFAFLYSIKFFPDLTNWFSDLRVFPKVNM